MNCLFLVQYRAKFQLQSKHFRRIKVTRPSLHLESSPRARCRGRTLKDFRAWVDPAAVPFNSTHPLSHSGRSSFILGAYPPSVLRWMGMGLLREGFTLGDVALLSRLDGSLLGTRGVCLILLRLTRQLLLPILRQSCRRSVIHRTTHLFTKSRGSRLPLRHPRDGMVSSDP